MLLEKAQVARFRSFFDSGDIGIEPDVTALVGKNESGKSSLLHALFRLNPANSGVKRRFELTEDYPRWRLTTDRRNGDLGDVTPIRASFLLEDADRVALAPGLGLAAIPEGTRCVASRTYSGALTISLELSLKLALTTCGAICGLNAEDLFRLSLLDSVDEVIADAQSLSHELESSGDTARAAAVAALPGRLYSFYPLLGLSDPPEGFAGQLLERLPKFFYFSEYSNLPGIIDLSDLLTKSSVFRTDAEDTALALLAFAGVTAIDLIETNFESRKAELEAAAIGLSRQVFEFWRQNEDLVVEFDDELKEVKNESGGTELHRMLDVRMRDMRHGGVSTNFNTRSSGFQWFFSFLAAFSAFESTDSRVIILLDEPGLSLHGDAQKHLLRFIFDRLGHSQQVIYTTHSQHMIDPTAYDKLRAVEDRATRSNPDIGTSVRPVRFASDRDTVLPVQAALGHQITERMFSDENRHLLIESGTDLVFLNEFSRYLERQGRSGLDPSLAILPVGGIEQIPAFIALFGRYVRVSALLNGGRMSQQMQLVSALIAEGAVQPGELVLCSDVHVTPPKASIEDLFEVEDYLRLVNWAYGTDLNSLPADETDEPLVQRVERALGVVFERGAPAAHLALHRSEFFGSVLRGTVERFGELCELLNATAEKDARWKLLERTS